MRQRSSTEVAFHRLFSNHLKNMVSLNEKDAVGCKENSTKRNSQDITQDLIQILGLPQAQQLAQELIPASNNDDKNSGPSQGGDPTMLKNDIEVDRNIIYVLTQRECSQRPELESDTGEKNAFTLYH